MGDSELEVDLDKEEEEEILVRKRKGKDLEGGRRAKITRQESHIPPSPVKEDEQEDNTWKFRFVIP